MNKHHIKSGTCFMLMMSCSQLPTRKNCTTLFKHGTIILANLVCALLSRKLRIWKLNTFSISSEDLEKTKFFHYLGSHLQSDDSSNECTRMDATWLRSKEIFGMLWDRHIPIHLRSKVCNLHKIMYHMAPSAGQPPKVLSAL